MSRLKILKEQNKKNRIKVASCGLALALLIGSAQGLGTNALFTDTLEVTDNLTISTGDVDVKMNEGFNKVDIKSGAEFTHKITISNDGTLKQNMEIALEHSVNWINFKVDFMNEQIRDIEKLSTEPQSLKDINGGLIILEPNTSIEASIIVKVGTVPEDVENKTISFNVNTYASQVNENNSGVSNGFYDIYAQLNTIQFRKEDIITSEDGQIKVAGLGQNNNFLEISYIDDFTKPQSVKVVENSGTGLFKDAIAETKSGQTFLINNVNAYKHPNYLFNNNYGVDTISIEFIYQGGGSKIVHFDFKSVTNVQGNRAAIARYTITPRQSSELEAVEQPKEEVGVPSDQEVIESPKKEVEVPSESEVVEAPKQEITEIPKQPEVIEPPTEIEEIQE